MMKKHRSLDPALQWLQDRYLSKGIHFPHDFAVSEIRNAVISDVTETLKLTNQKTPFEPSAIAHYRKVKRIMETDLSKDGILIPEIGGFLIKIKKNIHPFKKRLACAHELGHTFFYNIEADPPRREFSQHESSYWVQEEFSLFIAREILIPRFSIIPLIKTENIIPSIDSIRYLSAVYQVSFNVLRYRLINDLGLWDCIILNSRISEGKINTKKVDISKGPSYRELNVSQLVIENINLSYLLSSTLTERRIRDRINLDGKLYSVETILLDEERQSILTIIKSLPAHPDSYELFKT